MQTVKIGDLKNQLSAYLQCVRNGEEIVVRDRDVPVARILPFRQGPGWEREESLVAAGALKMPERPMDWDEFFAMPTGTVPQDVAVQAALESRGDR